MYMGRWMCNVYQQQLINYFSFMHYLLQPDCTSNQFKCLNGQCIPTSSQCDGYVQCFDGSDEIHCSELIDPMSKKKCSFYILIALKIAE